jgi:hypothetical protein
MQPGLIPQEAFTVDKNNASMSGRDKRLVLGSQMPFGRFGSKLVSTVLWPTDHYNLTSRILVVLAFLFKLFEVSSSCRITSREDLHLFMETSRKTLEENRNNAVGEFTLHIFIGETEVLLCLLDFHYQFDKMQTSLEEYARTENLLYPKLEG